MHSPMQPRRDDAVRLAWQIAPQRCATDPNSGTPCVWFHRVWPILRRIGLITAPADQTDFIQPALQQALRAGARRILVCGSADEATVEQVFDALDATGRDAEVVVLDLCPTPLELCRALAGQRGRPVTTVTANILDFAAAPFDVILTHSFFGYFDDAGRHRLMARWHELLRPGGTVIAINRVRPHEEAALTGFAADKKGDFVALALERARQMQLTEGLDAGELAQALRNYAGGKKTHPVRSLAAIRQMFEGAGFGLRQLDLAAVAARTDLPAFGPTTPGGASYARIHAVRG